MRSAILSTALVSAVSAGQCKLTPTGTCYSNGGAKIAHLPGIGSDPQKCCELCAQNPHCLSWNHGSYDTKTKLYACDLYSDVGPTKKSSTCVGGVRDGPLPPTPGPS